MPLPYHVVFFVGYNYKFGSSSSKVTAPQDVYGGLMLQVYLGSNTLEFSEIFVSKLVHCYLATGPMLECRRVQSSVVS